MADTSAASAASSLVQIPIDQIQPSPRQARKTFKEDAIQKLADSMKAEGLIEPVVVRQLGEQAFELISGERRFRAAQLLGWENIEAKVIHTVSEGEAAVKGLIENLLREDLNPLEEAEGIQAVLDLHDSHWSQAEIAKVVGKQQSEISETLRFLAFSDYVKELIRRLIITYGHAAQLVRLPTQKDQDKVAKKIEKGLSVMATRELVDKILNKKEAKKAGEPATFIRFSKSKTRLKFTGDVPLTLDAEALVSQFRQALMDWTAKSSKRADQASVVDEAAIEAAAQEMAAAPAPITRQEAEKVAEDSKKARFPKSPEDLAELERLAGNGPYDVFLWIYGEGNSFTQGVKGRSWEDCGFENAKDGLSKILGALKAIENGDNA